MNARGDTSQPVPRTVVESILRDHLADPTATLADLHVEPFANDGASGNNTLYRAQVAWTARKTASPGSAEWIIKRWEPGGRSEGSLGLTQPVEALAWQHGLLSPQALPPGVVVPFVGARIARNRMKAWIAMTDVSKELMRWGFAHPLPAEQALVRVKQVLGGYARLHAWWEGPEHQEKLAECSWLLPLENMLWRDASTLAIAMDKTAKTSPAKGRRVTEEYRASVQAFLDWLPPADRELWEELMADRRSLVAAFQPFNRTLLHGDPAERNIGLRWHQADAGTSQNTEGSAELILIDWEWPCLGPGALDIAIVLAQLLWICDPSQLCPEFCWSDGLPGYYFECYVSAGGRQIDHEAWRRSYELARVAYVVSDVLPYVGDVIRTLRGLVPVPRYVGVPEEVMLQHLRTGRGKYKRLIEGVTRTVRTWLA
jgi:hypothetical protein